MKLRKIGALYITGLLLLVFFVECSNEFKIAAKRRDQTKPAIYGNMVVWEDLRNLRWDVFGYNLSESKEIQFAPYCNNPAIYKDTVVWLYYKENSVEIYGYNLKTKKEFQIMASPSIFKGSPAIYGNIVVWVHRGRDRDIYGYDLATGQEFFVAAHIHEQDNPAIHGDYVVWQDERNYNWDIYGLNLETREEIEITTIPEDQIEPAIYGNTVVWADNRNRNYDIYGLNLETREEIEITTSPGDQKNPAIYGNTIVWADNRNGDYDIYGYSLSESQEFPLITSPGDQINPAIHGNTVVWEDNRNGDWDIYGVYLPSDLLDKDSDGYSYPEDCNDNDFDIHPGTKEICDGKDNNCNGQIDETCRSNVEVFVISSRGGELQGAAIFVDGTHKGKTDSDGKVTITDLFMNRKYVVRAEKEGYTPQEKPITISEDVSMVVFEMGTTSGRDAVFYSLAIGLFAFCFLALVFSVLKLKRAIRTAPRPKRKSLFLCPLCQTEIEEDWIVCPHCGADVEKTKDETRIY